MRNPLLSPGQIVELLKVVLACLVKNLSRLLSAESAFNVQALLPPRPKVAKHIKNAIESNLNEGLQLAPETGVLRCWWCGTDPLYVQYHDEEWGHPVLDENRLFEKICLEGFQAGLSWITILRKRESFRAAFENFDIEKVSRFGKRQINQLLQDASIVRHRGKIESVINNSQRALELLDSGGSLRELLWQDAVQSTVPITSKQQIVATSDASIRLSKTLKRMGWSFVGPTTCYALMQSAGIVNDHLANCHSWQTVEAERKKIFPTLR